MFGWINDCTESLIVTKFGIEKWHEVKAKAECTVEDNAFIRHEYYSDESTIALVVAASDVLGISVDDVLEAFGQYFMEFTRTNGYDNMLSCQGSTLRLWLSNLNALHDHLQSSLPKGFVAPVFWCEDDEVTEGSILLHYYSERGSLLVCLVVGVVKEVARYHFDLKITMERMQTQGEGDATFTTWRISTIDPTLQWKLTATATTQEGVSTKALAPHTAESSDAKELTETDNAGTSANPQASKRSYKLEKEGVDSSQTAVCPFLSASKDMKNEKNHEKSASFWNCIFQKKKEKEDTMDTLASNSSSNRRLSKNECAPESFSSDQCSPLQDEETGVSSAAVPASISMSGDKVKEVFPYHIVVDKDFRILQVGNSLSNLIGDSVSCIGRHVETILEIKRPVLGSWDWTVLNKLMDQTFFLQTVTTGKRTKVKANMIVLSTTPKQVMFVISPDAKNIAELTDMNLTMSDLPLHSFQRDAVFLGEHMYSEVRSAHKLDKLSKKLANERNLSNTLLYSMIPKDVANLLRAGEAFEPRHHKDVTLFFSDVVGFTSMCNELPPWDIIDMLNRLYTVMDFLAAKFNLYKVETIGDAYMCCSGLPDPDDLHAVNIANFSLAVKRCVQLVTSPLTGEPIHLRIGIHTGSCMSGVVGTLTPHYCLFGDMINTTSRHESTGESDKIQASSITFGRLTHFSDFSDHYNWTPRGLVDMKGKGKMFTYWLDSGTDENQFVGPKALDKLVEEVRDVISSKTWKKRQYFTRRRSGSTNMTELVDQNFNYDDNDGGEVAEKDDLVSS